MPEATMATSVQTPSIKLTYFGIQGVAEKVRLTYHIAGIPFEDDRVAFPDWPALKPSTPYGQLPMMSIDGGEMLAQSGAMVRYAGMLATQKSKADGGVTPALYDCSTPEKLLVIEEALGFVGDIQKAWMFAVYVGMKPGLFGHPTVTTDAEGKQVPVDNSAIVEKVRSSFVSDQLPPWMDHLTKKLKANGSAFLCGAQVTIADCDLVPTLTRMMSGGVDYVPTTCLDAWPEVKAYVERFMALPAVSAYYEGLKK